MNDQTQTSEDSRPWQQLGSLFGYRGAALAGLGVVVWGGAVLSAFAIGGSVSADFVVGAAVIVGGWVLVATHWSALIGVWMMLLGGLLLMPVGTPDTEVVMDAHSLYQSLLPVVVGVFAGLAAVVAIIHRRLPGLSDVGLRLVQVLVMFEGVRILMVFYGDQAYTWIEASPAAAISTAVALAAALPMVWVVGQSFRGASTLASGNFAGGPAGYAAGVMAASAPALPISRMDRERAAVHEAGHVVAFAAIRELPSVLRVQAHEYASLNAPALGWVDSGGAVGNRILSDSVSWWYLHLLLCGVEAERQVLGEGSLGVCNDHQRWREVAALWLASRGRESYDLEPADDGARDRNDRRRLALYDEIQPAVTALIRDNRELVRAIADTLITKEALERDELRAWLFAAQIPEGFPRIERLDVPGEEDTEGETPS